MKVLIVDDDIATVEVICSSVNWEKYMIQEVKTAYNIEGAKRVLEKEKIDIIICDIEMPMGNGTELLKWVRQKDMVSEFLFLTCHENFHYAATAIEYQAVGYLIKPFNVNRMEFELMRVVQKIKEKHQLLEESIYGKWMAKNKEKLLMDFWRALIFREIRCDNETINKELRNRRIELKVDKPYRIIGVRVSSLDKIRQELGCELLEFLLEKLIAEALEDELINTSVLRYMVNETAYYVVIDSEQHAEEILKERCQRLIRTGNNYLQCQFTCCIGITCEIGKLPQAAERIIQVIIQNVLYSGSCFCEKEIKEVFMGKERLLDLKQLEADLIGQDKIKILNKVKDVLEQRSDQHLINADILFGLQQEILQLVYTYLYKNGIQAAELYADTISQKLQKQAINSIFDMMKWVNYAVSRTLDYENETKRTFSVVEKVENFIHNHYQENISREEIAGSVFLAPEYLAKLYKKKTGRVLKDYLNQYRIEQAKMLLKSQEQSISDVAAMVGFDNFSYFSTVFKKYMGITPGEYRKSCLKI